MYIDPNSGGMLFQILLVLFGVFSALILLFSGKIRMILARIKRQIRERTKPETRKKSSDDEISPPTA
jgi:hypothetical protein